MNVRVLAWRVLRAKHPRPRKLASAVARRAKLGTRDRALLLTLVELEARRRGTLRALVLHFTGGEADADVAAHIAIAFTQAFFLDRVRERELLKETLRAARLTLGERPGRFIENALKVALKAREKGHANDVRRDLVLRDVSFAAPVFHDPAAHPLLWAEDALSLPVPLLKRWTKRLGEETAHQLARGALAAPDASLVVLRGDRDSVIAELASAKITARPGEHARVVLAIADTLARVRASAAFREGRIALLGETALRATELARSSAGENVLHLSAATDTETSSARTAVLAATGARVQVHDDSAACSARRTRFLARFGTAVERALGDATFDAVLVEPPCSDTGVLARLPAARWRFSAETQMRLTAAQDALLDRAAVRVRAGGRLVYTTASIEPEENQRRVRAFLARHTEFALEDEHAALPAERSRTGPMDGGYGARLARR